MNSPNGAGPPDSLSDNDRQAPATFGQWLKAKREERGFTLRKVEEICGGAISNAAISQVETGKIKSPSFTVIMFLAAAYGLSLDEVQHRAKHNNAPLPEPMFCPTCGHAMDDLIRRGS